MNPIHVRDAVDIQKVMVTVWLAAFPAMFFGMYNLGSNSLEYLDSINQQNTGDWHHYLVNIIGYDEEVNWVELTEFEKKIYESKKNGNCSRILLQQICCHILATDAMGSLFDNKEVNLSEIEGKLVDHNKQIITKYENKLSLLVPTMQEYHMLKKMYESKISEAKFFLKIVEKITSEDDHECDENCSVCLDKIENRVMTKCGHMFCKDCLDMCLQVKKTCPYCKNDLKGSDIYLTTDMGSTKNEEVMTNPLIQKYGSKLGKLISLARKLVIDEDNKLIIFSQWDRMLSLIGSALKENGVSNSVIQGLSLIHI